MAQLPKKKKCNSYNYEKSNSYNHPPRPRGSGGRRWRRTYPLRITG